MPAASTTAPPLDLDTLARRAIDGKHEALEPLLTGTLPMIRALVKRILPDRPQSHPDVEHAVVLDILTHLPTVRSSYVGFVRAWTRKRILLEVAAARRERRTVPLDAAVDVADPRA